MLPERRRIVLFLDGFNWPSRHRCSRRSGTTRQLLIVGRDSRLTYTLVRPTTRSRLEIYSVISRSLMRSQWQISSSRFVSWSIIFPLSTTPSVIVIRSILLLMNLALTSVRSLISCIHSQSNMVFEEFIQLIVREDRFLHRHNYVQNLQVVTDTLTTFLVKFPKSRDARPKRSSKSSQKRWCNSSSSSIICQLRLAGRR